MDRLCNDSFLNLQINGKIIFTDSTKIEYTINDNNAHPCSLSCSKSCSANVGFDTTAVYNVPFIIENAIPNTPIKAITRLININEYESKSKYG